MAAFTDAEKAAIRDVLGYPDVTTYPNFRLEGSFAACSDEAHDRIVVMLAQIDTIDTGYVTSVLEGRFKEVEDIKFNVGGATSTMSSARLYLARRIAAILGVNVANDTCGGGPTRQ